jgi:hypothetical protein
MDPREARGARDGGALDARLRIAVFELTGSLANRGVAKSRGDAINICFSQCRRLRGGGERDSH